MICFAWVEFPQYGARLVGAFVRTTKQRVVVVATKPRIPIQGMDRLAGCEIFWEPKESKRSLREIIGETPSHLFVSGWSLPVYRKYCAEVHRAGGRNIALVDNDYRPCLSEVIKKLRFRILIGRRFDAFLVPGKAGVEFLHYYGVSDEKIYKGLYAADAALFTPGKPLSRRPRRIVYVGQFCNRKNTLRMCEAFLCANEMNDEKWILELCGKGPLREFLPKDPYIVIHDFVQPENLPTIYQGARGFILPSKNDHWGLVVHEGALSGCALLISDQVGSRKDFVGELNGRLFSPTNLSDMVEAYRWLMTRSPAELNAAYEESRRLSANASLRLFVDSVQKIIRGFK